MIVEQPKFYYDAEVVRVIDGDTVDLLVDLGFHTHVKVRVRLLNIDAPECQTETIEDGHAATEHLRQMLFEGQEMGPMGAGPPVRLRTKKTRSGSSERGKYGRYIGIIWFVDRRDGSVHNSTSPWTEANEEMVASGHAVWWGED